MFIFSAAGNNDIAVLSAEDILSCHTVGYGAGVGLIGCNIAESGIAGSFAVEGDFGVAGHDAVKSSRTVDYDVAGKFVGSKNKVVVVTAEDMNSGTVCHLTAGHIKGAVTAESTCVHIDITLSGNGTFNLGIMVNSDGIAFSDDDLTAVFHIEIMDSDGLCVKVIEAAGKIKDQCGSLLDAEGFDHIGNDPLFTVIFAAVAVGIVPECKVVNSQSCTVDNTEFAVICKSSQLRSKGIVKDSDPDIIQTTAVIDHTACGTGIVDECGVDIAVNIRSSGKLNDTAVDIDFPESAHILPAVDGKGGAISAVQIDFTAQDNAGIAGCGNFAGDIIGGNKIVCGSKPAVLFKSK